MHIPYIVFIIILTGLAFWFNKERLDARKELEESLSTERKRAQELSEQQFNLHLKETEDLTIAVISATFDCGFYEAEKKYNILKSTHNVIDFIHASYNTQRIRIYEKAISEYSEESEE